MKNGNGLQNTNEIGVAGIAVTLYTTSGYDPISSTVTDSAGDYRFDILDPNDFYVIFDLATLPANHNVVVPNQGADDVDSDADGESGRSSKTGILFSGEEYLSLDMGIYEKVDGARLGNRVWYDLNGNGIQNPREPGVENVLVTLLESETGLPVADIPPQLTDGNGVYRFEGFTCWKLSSRL